MIVMRYLKLIISVILLFIVGTISVHQSYANLFVASVSFGYVSSSGFISGLLID